MGEKLLYRTHLTPSSVTTRRFASRRCTRSSCQRSFVSRAAAAAVATSSSLALFAARHAAISPWSSLIEAASRDCASLASRNALSSSRVRSAASARHRAWVEFGVQGWVRQMESRGVECGVGLKPRDPGRRETKRKRPPGRKVKVIVLEERRAPRERRSRDGDRRESGRASASSRPRKSAISARASASARRGGASASNARSLSRMPWISADARLASRSAAASLSASPAHSGSFHTKRCRGGVQRRQLELKGVEAGIESEGWAERDDGKSP